MSDFDSTSTIQATLKAQRRRRRLMFWAGFFAIAIVGSLWAGLSKDPVGPDFFGLVSVGRWL